MPATDIHTLEGPRRLLTGQDLTTPRDPDLHAAYLEELRRETARQAAWYETQARWNGVGDTVPEPFTPKTHAELTAAAQAALARRRAWRQSPEGQFRARLVEAEGLVATLSQALTAARAAASRNWDRERDACRDRAEEVFRVATQLRSAALDMSVAADAPAAQPATAAAS